MHFSCFLLKKNLTTGKDLILFFHFYDTNVTFYNSCSHNNHKQLFSVVMSFFTNANTNNSVAKRIESDL